MPFTPLLRGLLCAVLCPVGLNSTLLPNPCCRYACVREYAEHCCVLPFLPAAAERNAAKQAE